MGKASLLVKDIPRELMEQIRKQAEKERRTIKMTVIRALEEYLERERVKNG